MKEDRERRREKELDGQSGVRCGFQQPTELAGDILYKAYEFPPRQSSSKGVQN